MNQDFRWVRLREQLHRYKETLKLLCEPDIKGNYINHKTMRNEYSLWLNQAVNGSFATWKLWRKKTNRNILLTKMQLSVLDLIQVQLITM